MSGRGWIGSIVVLAVVIAALAQPHAAQASTNWVVTNNGDSASTCPSPTQCTLRGAVGAASSGDTITVPAGTYSISAGPIAVSTSLQIVGPSGAGATTTHAPAQVGSSP